jgi:deaminated glutathione amidase
MRVALCQLPISPDPAINLERVAEAMTTAAQQGADLAVFPEATQVRFGSDLRGAAEPLDGAFGAGLAELARETGVALVAGVFEPAPDGCTCQYPPTPNMSGTHVSPGQGHVCSGTAPGGRVYNTAVAYSGSGELVAAYRKIHLFDSLGERESALVAPGSEPVVADLAGVRTGFATCYDIRFPELARALVARGAELIVVPGAWAAGLFKEEHWVTLVRARAIENTVWVAAAGQVPDPASPPTRAPTGVGRSMLVDPMGTVRADLGLWPQVTVAELDSALTARVRTVLPCLEHRRDDVFGPADPAGPVPPASPVSGPGPATERDAAPSR